MSESNREQSQQQNVIQHDPKGQDINGYYAKQGKTHVI